MVAQNRAGPRPIPYRRLTSKRLSEALQYCLGPEAQQAAMLVAEKMQTEIGVKAAVRSFHRHLPASVMGCDLVAGLPATWAYTKSRRAIKLSGAAAEILIRSRRIKAEDLRLYKSKPISIENRRWDFVTSSMSVSMGVSYDIIASLSGFWRNPQKLHERNSRQRALARVASEASSSAIGDEVGEISNKEIAKMVGASAMSIPHFAGATVKAFLVDVPVAFAEGFRNTPKLYGEKVKAHEPVTDWKSGFKVAGTTFAQQMAEGLTDILVQPVKGAAKEGVIGFGTGLGKGTMGTLTKPTAGELYPFLPLGTSSYGIKHASGSLDIPVKAFTSLFTQQFTPRRRNPLHLLSACRTNTSFAQMVQRLTVTWWCRSLTGYHGRSRDRTLSASERASHERYQEQQQVLHC